MMNGPGPSARGRSLAYPGTLYRVSPLGEITIETYVIQGGQCV